MIGKILDYILTIGKQSTMAFIVTNVIVLFFTITFALSAIFGADKSINTYFLGGIVVLILFGVVANLVLGYGLRARQQKISRLETSLLSKEFAIQNTGEIQSPIYEIETWHESYDIQDQGDTVFTRTCNLKYLSIPVYWYLIGITLIEGDRISSLEELIFTATNLQTGENLKWVPLIYTPERIRIAVLLDPIVTEKNKNFNISVKLHWKGLYKPLVRDLFDIGSITIINPTKEVKLSFVLPESLTAKEFKISPSIGKYLVTTPIDARSTITFTATDVSPGLYKFWLYTSLKTNFERKRKTLH